MTREKDVQLYRKRLREIGTDLVRLSGDDRYLERLVNGSNLLPLDQALRDFIVQFGE